MANEKRLIDADALLDKIQFRIEPQGIVGATVRDMVEKTREIIKAAPTVDAVEVVHGAWMDFADSFEKRRGRMDLRCSVCRNRASKFVYGTEDWWDGCKPNYCPNCGAKMDGGNEDG